MGLGEVDPFGSWLGTWSSSHPGWGDPVTPPIGHAPGGLERTGLNGIFIGHEYWVSFPLPAADPGNPGDRTPSGPGPEDLGTSTGPGTCPVPPPTGHLHRVLVKPRLEWYIYEQEYWVSFPLPPVDPGIPGDRTPRGLGH